ncbi:MAG: DUF559 domain-containing protein [Chloroflexi bacterium]|nr:DUF559 domain-containing protein [Chloroflexota bacterium]
MMSLKSKHELAERSKYFESLGYMVIRFWNNQVSTGSFKQLNFL